MEEINKMIEETKKYKQELLYQRSLCASQHLSSYTYSFNRMINEADTKIIYLLSLKQNFKKQQ